jgi:iron-sulfur cluster assembly accessory protein
MVAIIALRYRVNGNYDLEFTKAPGEVTGDERKLLSKESKTMILTLTDSAASEVKKFLEAENVGMDGGLRVRVVPGGCSGFQYAMNIEEAPQANDEVVESSGCESSLTCSAHSTWRAFRLTTSTASWVRASPSTIRTLPADAGAAARSPLNLGTASGAVATGCV